jgi:UDP-GlcNAc3NAcA epimerase
MKIATVVGARPQFIKCAPVSRELRKACTEILIHTGQHYDGNMSQVFFDELSLPRPDYHLGVGSGPHGAQCGEMLKRIEEVLVQERPDYVMVYGDTNSTLAGALAAAKLHMPVAHVEAGLRSFNRRMPEEINRVVADHLSSFLFCPTEAAVKNLTQEGITAGVRLVGDVMYDALLISVQAAEEKSTILKQLRLCPKEYFLVTVHRAENTDDAGRLQAIIKAIQRISAFHPVVWPVHPRTRRVLGSQQLSHIADHTLRIIDPVSYLDMLVLEKAAKVILTDSGGVQKEAYWLGIPCVTLREETEWVETVQAGWNMLVGTDPDRIVAAALKKAQPWASARSLQGDSGAAVKIVHTLLGN